MSVLDRLPEHSLSAEMRARKAESEELKGSFQSLGSGSIVTERIFSSATYDFQFTASSTPGTVIAHQADVEFIPDDMKFGGAFCYRLMARVLDDSNNPITYIDPQQQRLVTTDGTQKWRFHHISSGYPGDTIRLKLYFYTTGSGTFTANVIV